MPFHRNLLWGSCALARYARRLRLGRLEFQQQELLSAATALVMTRRDASIGALT
jgi:hypothetical protein